ncbi:transmembrane repetitive protein [Pseudoxanthomonas wuyuanensis]
MTKAADLIAALLPRRPAPMLERHTGLPYGWGLWMRGLPARLGTISREKAEAVVTAFAGRPPPPGSIAPALNRLQSVRSLFYQNWEPPPREERGIRFAASTISVLMHLLFVALLVLVAVVKLPPPPSSSSEGSRVRVEFIGQGTPEEEGGGAPVAQQSPAPASATAASGAVPQRPAPQAAASAEPAPPQPQPPAVPPLPTRDIPEPSVPASQQPLQVTETPIPTREFVLPPPVPPTEIAPPQVRPSEIQVPVREVAIAEAPTVRRDIPLRPIDTPQVQLPTQEIRQREIAAPIAPPALRPIPVPDSSAAATAELQTPEASIRQREIAAPSSSRPSTASAAADTSDASSASAREPAASAGTPSTSRSSAARGIQPGASAAGPAAADRPGGWATPARADDWGASTRNAPGDSGANAGTTPGLFNADGSVRLPGDGAGTETADRGAPGGNNDAWTREQIEQAGTWLQRPPYDYEPTTFDKYWVPNESLLAEWVRRNIRETVIPIPGTNKKIRCVVSVLQLGGGCGLFDPNLNEQPAQARPPPEIPVKRTPIPTDS